MSTARRSYRTEVLILAIGALLSLVAYIWSSAYPEADPFTPLVEWTLILGVLLWPLVKYALLGMLLYSLAMWLFRALVRAVAAEIRRQQ